MDKNYCDKDCKQIKAQISFSKDADLVKVKEQLIDLKNKYDYEFHCCFLPRHIVELKGFSTEIVDLLESTLGESLIWDLKKYETFEEAMTNIEMERSNLAIHCDKLFVLDSRIAPGVIIEIKGYTSRLTLLP